MVLGIDNVLQICSSHLLVLQLCINVAHYGWRELMHECSILKNPRYYVYKLDVI